jgi:OOP family OmpA-OmpF porin
MLLLIGTAEAEERMDLPLPGPARVTASVAERGMATLFATAAWNGTGVPGEIIDGDRRMTAWRVAPFDGTTQDLTVPLRGALTKGGFEVRFECESAACGGFDFRYALPVLSEPEMHVDLIDYRYVHAARAGVDSPGGATHVSLLVSRSSSSGFVQLIEAGPGLLPAAGEAPAVEPAVNPLGDPGTTLDAPDPALVQPDANSVSGPPPDDGAAGAGALAFDAAGRAALDDLVFPPGSSELGEGRFASLRALADYLEENPNVRVALVGHTDAQGALDVNIALSRRRAASVVRRLVDTYGADPARLAAEGVGYLSPRASNLTEEGRTLNRRVEAILLSTEAPP